MATIKEKIQKLLSLATSSNENEARAALLKAKELMAKNKLTEADFEDAKKQELVHVTLQDIKWTSDSGDVWMADLCKLIADNYCCTSAWSRNRGARTYTLVVSGLQSDVDICSEVIKYAVGFIRSRIKILSRRSGDRRMTSKSYADGFVLGMQMAFDMQKEEHPEWGLVVVKPDELTDYEKSLGSKSVKTKKAKFDQLAYMKGQTDGQNFNTRKVLAG